MKCPICNTELTNDANICYVCDFADLHREFINVDDANDWKNSVLAHHRALWLLKNKEHNMGIKLDSEESKIIFQKYCTNQNHIYTFKNLTINTKFATFIWEDFEEGHKKVNIQKFGYEYFEIGYKLNGNDIFFYMQDKEKPEKTYGIATITTTNDSTRKELLTIFEFMKTGGLHFDYAFDDTVKWYEHANTDNYYVMKNYFSDESIKPITFSAKYTEYDEYSNENNIIEIDSQFEIVVENEFGKVWSVKDQEENSPKIMQMVRRHNKLSEKTTIDLSKERDDIYFDENTLSIFIGDRDNYQRFEFEDPIMARRVFDYMVILFTHII